MRKSKNLSGRKSLLANKEFFITLSFSPNFTCFYNLGQTIWRRFHSLEQFLFNTGDTELNYHQQKVNVRLVIRLATYNLRTLKNLKKIPEILKLKVSA